MRKEYGKALRMLFEQHMKRSLPDYVPVKISSIYFTPGDRAFEKKAGNGTSLWISLSINPKYESFNIEIGWSKLGRWPELSMRPSSIRPNGSSEFAKEEYITRLSFLWTIDDYWFEIEPFDPNLDLEGIIEKMKPIKGDKAMKQVTPLVEECFDKISKFAISYFEGYTERSA